MAVFGVPVPCLTIAEIAEDARHTVAYAVGMGDRLRTLIRIGINGAYPSCKCGLESTLET